MKSALKSPFKFVALMVITLMFDDAISNYINHYYQMNIVLDTSVSEYVTYKY